MPREALDAPENLPQEHRRQVALARQRRSLARLEQHRAKVNAAAPRDYPRGSAANGGKTGAGQGRMGSEVRQITQIQHG
jgi:hypothetical protein